MDEELVLARIELARLDAQADNLLQQFLNIKEAAAAQRTKIDEILRKRPTPINQLPAELLLDILSLAMPSKGDVSQYLHSSYGLRRLELASVSRRWRDIICGCPSFWTTIEVGPSTPSLAIHLKRSKDAPLDVIIRCQPVYGSTARTAVDQILAKLASLIASVHRWRTMVIIGDVGLLQLHHPIVSKFSRLTFPSLKSVIIRPSQPLDPISANALLTYPDFLAPKRTPVLEHMELDGYSSSAHLRTANTLKTLKLTILPEFTGFDSTFLRRIPAESLTTLSLTGDIALLALARNSVPFPVLRTLILHCTGGKQFLEAIVVPNLERFVYIRDIREHHGAAVFGDLESKFDHVQQLSFSWAAAGLGLPTDFDLDRGDTIALLNAFPFVHHAEVDLRVIYPVFDHPGSWRLLQSLTFNIILGDDWSLGTDRLVSWLKARQGLGLPRLRLKLSAAPFDNSWKSPPESDVGTFAKLYEDLRMHCDLYLEDFLLRPSMFLSMEGNSPLRVVSLESCDVQ